MRCRIGDLAVMTQSRLPENIGRVVEVICPGEHETGLPAWVIQSARPLRFLPWGRGRVFSDCTGNSPDAWLRPIRDSDGEDEVLRIAGKPQETPREMLESIRRELA